VCHGPLVEGPDALACTACTLDYRTSDGVYVLGPAFALNGAARGGTRVLETPAEGAPMRERLDPCPIGWKFLTDLRPTGRVLVVGARPDSGPLALALALAHGAAYVVVLDRDIDRLKAARRKAVAHGLDHVFFVRLVDPLRVPLPPASIDLAVVPGLDDWFGTKDGGRRVRSERVQALLEELRRVLTLDGQAYVASPNARGVPRLLPRWRRESAGCTPSTLRTAALAAGFAGCRVYAPFPYPHKFHQIIDLERGSEMNLCPHPYRARGPALRSLVRAWDTWNVRGGLERRLYPYLPAVSAVLSTSAESRPFAERVLAEVGAASASVSRYYVRAQGVAVLVAGVAGDGGRIIRMPLDETAEQGCARQQRALRVLADDVRMPAELRALFPLPLVAGRLAGQAYFVESALPGESARIYYSRSTRRFDRAIVSASDTLSALRRATEVSRTIDEETFAHLCGDWLPELRVAVGPERRPILDRVGEILHETLVGRTLPLGWYHGDYDFANLLYDAHDRLSGIIDFELFDARGLPLVDHMVLLARRHRRRVNLGFGTLFLRGIFPCEYPPLERRLLTHEMDAVGADGALYRALALFAWADHVRLRRDSWLARSPHWRHDNVDVVLDGLRGRL
jgi:aminoglycoside phosphotransferase (APT) family kinase protein/SAM-dependent methyltransferase